MILKIVLVAIALNMGVMSFVIYMQYLLFRKVYGGPKKVKEKNKRAAFVPDAEADAEYVPEPPKKRYRARVHTQRPQR